MPRGRLSPELAEQLGLPQRVVDEMVTERVINQRAAAEGLGLTDEEFNAAVHAMREFQDNGRFSMDRYRRFLQVRGVEAEEQNPSPDRAGPFEGHNLLQLEGKRGCRFVKGRVGRHR